MMLMVLERCLIRSDSEEKVSNELLGSFRVAVQ